MKTDILIATVNRNHLLKWNLESLKRQRHNAGIIILDDAFVSDLECKQLADKYGCRYIHTGKTKRSEEWRVPGFAVNIGIKQSTAEVVIISCAEMFHLGNTVSTIVTNLTNNPMLMSTVDGRFDDKSILNCLERGKVVTEEHWDRLNTKHLSHWLPYFLGVKRNILLEIGGYDEDFIGVAADDNDLRDRLRWYGCEPSHKGREWNPTLSRGAKIIHLWHPPATGTNRHGSNRAIWLNKRAKKLIVRNQDKEWGKL